MAIMFHFIRANLFITLIFVTSRINTIATNNDDFGPYLEVYPPVDLSQNQLDCVPEINRTCPLYIALTMPFGGEYFGGGVMPGVQFAIDEINADPGLLPGYSLHYTLTDSQVYTMLCSCMIIILLLIKKIFPRFVYSYIIMS